MIILPATATAREGARVKDIIIMTLLLLLLTINIYYEIQLQLIFIL